MSEKQNTQYRTLAEQLAIKVQRNEPCPCGAFKILPVMVKGKDEAQGVRVPKKYKECCMNTGALFFKDEETARRAGVPETEISKQTQKDANEAI